MWSMVIVVSLVALVVSLSVMPRAIEWLGYYHVEQFIQGDGPKHARKAHTPTSSGVVLVMLLLILTGLLIGFSLYPVLVVILVFLGFMGIGLADDVLKIANKNNDKGLSARQKMALQVVLALLTVVAYACWMPEVATLVVVPLGGQETWIMDWGWFYYVVAVFAIVGASNAFNLADGLDGLAGGLSAILSMGLMFATVSSVYVGVAMQFEICLLLGILLGLLLGFLWFNAAPAQVFLGDSGSLSLGAGLMVVAMFIKQEVVFALMAGVFVMETLSVMLQVGYFKWSKGKRLFKMAPLHHHFELSGIAETKIVVRFWIIGLIFVALGVCLIM